MTEIKTRAKFGSNKQETQSQTTADNAPELEVNDTPAHHNEQANLNLRPKPETKSKRVALLMKESVYNKLKGRAKQQARSVNDLVNALVEAYLSQPDA